MMIRVIYENGVFRPLDPVPFPEGYIAGVEVPISMKPEFADEWTDPENDGEPLAERIAREIERLTNRTPEEIQAARERLAIAPRFPRPLMPGNTPDEGGKGKWPGDEANDPIREDLERMS